MAVHDLIEPHFFLPGRHPIDPVLHVQTHQIGKGHALAQHRALVEELFVILVPVDQTVLIVEDHETAGQGVDAFLEPFNHHAPLIIALIVRMPGPQQQHHGQHDAQPAGCHQRHDGPAAIGHDSHGELQAVCRDIQCAGRVVEHGFVPEGTHIRRRDGDMIATGLPRLGDDRGEESLQIHGNRGQPQYGSIRGFDAFADRHGPPALH